MFILLIAIINVIHALNRDTNTFSNYQQVQIQKVHVEWLLDLDNKFINCTAEYNFEFVQNGVNELHLDVFQMDIIAVYDYKTGYIFKHQIEVIDDQSLKQGDRLRIFLSRKYFIQEKLSIRIKYSLTEKARALSFMTKEQTETKTIPYLYSLCQSNNCRSIIPLQDTPSIKQQFSALILVRDPRIKVYITGNLLKNQPFKRMQAYGEKLTEYHFSLDIKIPSYLFAIVAGNLVERKVGSEQSRSYVITEPTSIDRVSKELEDLQEYVDFLADYMGKYEWGDYKIVVLPPSFPFGGMEHPLLTFASPNIIVGDKTGVGTAMHEIAHSWVGNTVTCSDWSNLWINEGLCTFLERKIIEHYFGEDYTKMYAFLANDTMFQQMTRFGMDHSYASMHPNVTGDNPDNAYSEVPYNKGYQLLVYIESLIGENNFKQLLRDYIIQFKWQSIDEDIFYRYLLQWISTHLGQTHDSITEIKTIYKEWIYAPGKPPRQLDFSTKTYDDAMILAKAWLDNKGEKVPDDANLFNNYIYYQKEVFLNEFAVKFQEMTQKLYQLLDQTYNLTELKDPRLLYTWFIGCVRGKYYDKIEKIKRFVGSYGEKFWVIDLYEALYKDQPNLALEWFEEFRYFYHPSIVDALENGVFNKKEINELRFMSDKTQKINYLKVQ